MKPYLARAERTRQSGPHGQAVCPTPPLYGAASAGGERQAPPPGVNSGAHPHIRKFTCKQKGQRVWHEYIKRRRSGEKVNLKDLAEKLGVTYGTVRNWKRIDQWDDAVERKRGGQPGNKNSRGKRNAKGNPGGGAPNGNTNAEKDGAYSTVHLERLSQEERDWLDQMPTGANENNIYELKLLRIQQRHIMERIAEYESCDPEKLFTASITDMRKPGKDKDGKQADGAVQKMVMDNKDSAFVRVTQLREALNKVSGRIISLTTQIRQQEEFEKRYALELERLDIAKMRATGEVDVDPEGGTEDETVHD